MTDRDKAELTACFIGALEVWKKELYRELAAMTAVTIEEVMKTLADIMVARSEQMGKELRKALEERPLHGREAGFKK